MYIYVDISYNFFKCIERTILQKCCYFYLDLKKFWLPFKFFYWNYLYLYPIKYISKIRYLGEPFGKRLRIYNATSYV